MPLGYCIIFFYHWVKTVGCENRTKGQEVVQLLGSGLLNTRTDNIIPVFKLSLYNSLLKTSIVLRYGTWPSWLSSRKFDFSNLKWAAEVFQTANLDYCWGKSACAKGHNGKGEVFILYTPACKDGCSKHTNKGFAFHVWHFYSCEVIEGLPT